MRRSLHPPRQERSQLFREHRLIWDRECVVAGADERPHLVHDKVLDHVGGRSSGDVLDCFRDPSRVIRIEVSLAESVDVSLSSRNQFAR